jgi:hypothetical protein
MPDVERNACVIQSTRTIVTSDILNPISLVLTP